MYMYLCIHFYIIFDIGNRGSQELRHSQIKIKIFNPNIGNIIIYVLLLNGISSIIYVYEYIDVFVMYIYIYLCIFIYIHIYIS
jgi:hypothetical protein